MRMGSRPNPEKVEVSPDNGALEGKPGNEVGCLEVGKEGMVFEVNREEIICAGLPF